MIKCSLSLPWRHIEGVEVWLCSFLTSAPDGSEWLISHLSCLLLGRNLLYPLNWRLGRSRSWSGQFGEEKSLAPTRFQTLNCPDCSLASTLDMLLQLNFSSYSGWIIWFGTGEILKWVFTLFLLISYFASWVVSWILCLCYYLNTVILTE